ncbi:MAG: type VI secretion system lipoprotein TssJ [Nitrospirota bacterium]|nr:type VI secretion system lipoprotein TssJ [Nitrospirota bacterium]
MKSSPCPCRFGPRTQLLMVAGFLMFASCSSVHVDTSPNDAVRQKVHWAFQKEAITLEVQADPQLNWSDDRPHTMVIGVLELQNPNGFLPLVQNPDRAMETLAAGKKGPGILAVRRFIVTPGARQDLVIDRMRDAMYIGVITGYSRYAPETDIVLRSLPVRVKRSGLIFRSNHYRPAQGFIQVLLGKRHLLGVNVLELSSGKTTDKKTGNTSSSQESPVIHPLSGDSAS